MTSRRVLGGLAALLAAWVYACAPHLPPTTVPPPANPELATFQKALQAYVNQTQDDRKQAAQAGDRVASTTGTGPNAELGVRTRQQALADAISVRLRPGATQGGLLDEMTARIVRQQVADAFKGSRRELLIDAIAEQNEDAASATSSSLLAVNQHVDAPRVPPLLIEVLPPLPPQLEYDFIGRVLLIRDVDADVVIDFLPDTLPNLQERTEAEPEAAAAPANGSFALALPALRGGTVFALMGDSGSGDVAQQQVAQAMLAYFNNGRRFPFVLMLGDNLYHDDYTGEFLVPYKPLLDRGVTFYAAIGNHDRDLQIHFKPFNMQDRDYYSIDRGNARFVALNSNHPVDAAQRKWFETVFDGVGNKWRIAFFHHPLYSSGQHADESRNVIRPAFEEMLVKAQVNVVFSGHEHLYERIAPQRGIRYFVSGGGGRNLYSVNPSSFDESAVSQHHFMVVEIAGDTLLFQAVTHDQKLLDCGVIYRTPDASTKADKDTLSWVDNCNTLMKNSGLPRPASP